MTHEHEHWQIRNDGNGDYCAACGEHLSERRGMSDTKTPNPVVLAAKRKVEDKAKRRGRAYGLGERNPKTLPGAHADSESDQENAQFSARWERLGKLVKAGRLTGVKYV